MEMLWHMLNEIDLPKCFWVEDANTELFLQNLLPTKALLNKTPPWTWPA